MSPQESVFIKASINPPVPVCAVGCSLLKRRVSARAAPPSAPLKWQLWAPRHQQHGKRWVLPAGSQPGPKGNVLGMTKDCDLFMEAPGDGEMLRDFEQSFKASPAFCSMIGVMVQLSDLFLLIPYSFYRFVTLLIVKKGVLCFGKNAQGCSMPTKGTLRDECLDWRALPRRTFQLVLLLSVHCPPPCCCRPLPSSSRSFTASLHTHTSAAVRSPVFNLLSFRW